MAIGVWQLVIILALALIIFGGSRLPELGRGLGLSLSNFRKALKDEPDEPASEEHREQSKHIEG